MPYNMVSSYPFSPLYRYVCARPAGKRCFVVSSNGTTISRLRNGSMLHRFPSALPNGARVNNSTRSGQSYCILDCIFHEVVGFYNQENSFLIPVSCPYFDFSCRLSWIEIVLQLSISDILVHDLLQGVKHLADQADFAMCINQAPPHQVNWMFHLLQKLKVTWLFSIRENRQDWIQNRDNLQG